MVQSSLSVKLSWQSSQLIISVPPLFLGEDQLDNGEVIVTREKSLKEEAEILLSHSGIYLEVVFGSVVWDAFTDLYRLNMKDF